MARIEAPAGADVVTAPAREVSADFLVVPVFERDDLGDLPELDRATEGEISRAFSTREFRGKPCELFVTRLAGGWRARRLALVGLGPPGSYSLDRLRLAAAAAGLACRQGRPGSIAWVQRAPGDPVRSVQAIVESLTLAEFDPGAYKTVDHEPPAPAALQVVIPSGEPAALRAAAERGRLLGISCNLARTLANEPGNILTPRTFVERGAELAAGAGLAAEILDENDLARLGMGLLLGVARGSAEPPRLLVLRHAPQGAPATPVLGLVGKGLTFDSGGISIKPAEGMDRMKDDMAGGGAVICAMRALALLGAPVRVIGIVPATENMPGSRALKPGDILRSASGKTVEVVNTDAEGRLVLADALWHAQQLGATHLVDVATLTGACVVALGRIATGLLGAPDDWLAHVRQVADRSGDRVWPLPVFDEYAEQLRSDVADLINSGGRPAGAITAAMFLKQFVGDTPWAHLDIAGTAWSEEARPYQPKGPTGVAVRTLAELAFTELPAQDS